MVPTCSCNLLTTYDILINNFKKQLNSCDNVYIYRRAGVDVMHQCELVMWTETTRTIMRFVRLRLDAY